MVGKPLLSFDPPEKPLKDLSNKEVTLFMLKSAAAGLILSSGLVAPNILQVYAQLGIIDNPRARRKLSNKFAYLKRSGHLVAAKNKYVLGKKGERLLTEDRVWSLVPKKPKKWDGTWHAVLYDVPSKKERARHALYRRLRELGYERYQDSVFLGKYSIKKEMKAFAGFYGVGDHLRFLTIKSFE